MTASTDPPSYIVRLASESTRRRESRAPWLDVWAVAPPTIVRLIEHKMTARLHRMTAVRLEEPDDINLARLDDDGGARSRSTVETCPKVRDARFETPMIPGARELGMLTTFAPPVVILEGSPVTMDAATIAARQREGGGAPSDRRRSRERSRWQNLRQALYLLVGVDRR